MIFFAVNWMGEWHAPVPACEYFGCLFGWVWTGLSRPCSSARY